jgi:hypothetical protein
VEHLVFQLAADGPSQVARSGINRDPVREENQIEARRADHGAAKRFDRDLERWRFRR